MKIHGLILAAGHSSRLGQPKQLIQYQGRSLLQHIEHRLLSCVDEVWTVLGFEHQLMQAQLSHSHVLINPNWSAGMGESLALGSRAASANAAGLLVALCDQPLIPLAHFQQLIQQFKLQPQSIINTHYADTHGVPALFPEASYPDLYQLSGRHGAQHLFKNRRYQQHSVPCEAAGFDLDTPTDLAQLISGSLTY